MGASSSSASTSQRQGRSKRNPGYLRKTISSQAKEIAVNPCVRSASVAQVQHSFRSSFKGDETRQTQSRAGFSTRQQRKGAPRSRNQSLKGSRSFCGGSSGRRDSSSLYRRPNLQSHFDDFNASRMLQSTTSEASLGKQRKASTSAVKAASSTASKVEAKIRSNQTVKRQEFKDLTKRQNRLAMSKSTTNVQQSVGQQTPASKQCKAKKQ